MYVAVTNSEYLVNMSAKDMLLEGLTIADEQIIEGMDSFYKEDVSIYVSQGILPIITDGDVIGGIVLMRVRPILGLKNVESKVNGIIKEAETKASGIIHNAEVEAKAFTYEMKQNAEKEIKEMPNYFEPYNTVVHFISEEELKEKHGGIPHGGFVIRSGKTGLNSEHNHIIEYSLKLDSNPEFTGSVLVAYARAAYRLNKRGEKGCKTVFDVAPAYLSPISAEDLRAHLL